MIRSLRNFFKNYIDTHYKDWDISIALRYLPIVADIQKNYQEGESILEVGSEISGITPYLQKPVTGVDIDFDMSKKNEYLTPVKASAVELPFKDRSFDYVLSVDMLEHLPIPQRFKAIMEILRVAKKKVYLAFPSGKSATLSDNELNQYYLRRRGEDHPYLKEHLGFGLPDFREVKAELEKHPEFKIKIVGNTNIYLWNTLLRWGLSDQKFQSSLYRRLLLLLPVLKHLNFGSTYRKMFILERVR